MLYNCRVTQSLVLEPPRGHIIIGMNPFIHHRDDVSGVWKHGMMLHNSCGEAVKNGEFCGSCKKELGRLEGFPQWGVGWGMCTLCEKCVGVFHQQKQLQPHYSCSVSSRQYGEQLSFPLPRENTVHQILLTVPDHLGLVSNRAFTKPRTSQVVLGGSWVYTELYQLCLCPNASFLVSR